MIDLRQANEAAEAIASRVLRRASGPMIRKESSSHHVYAGAEVVIKLIAAADHRRLDREIVLACDLLVGLSSVLLDSGSFSLESGTVRYACYQRVDGEAPGIGMTGVDSKAMDQDDRDLRCCDEQS